MLTDPLFILGFIGMAVCLFSWIKFTIEKNEVEPFVVRYISSISLISGLALLLSIFYNSCLLYTSPSPRDVEESRMPSSA